MTLSPTEAEQFYRIWIPLPGLANAEANIRPDWPTAPKNGAWGIKPADAIQARDALWAHPQLLDQFLSENPAKLSDEDIAIAASWKYRVTGDFTILRQMKKHAIFIQGVKVYAVLGLMNEIEDIVEFMPTLVKTTLLPFGQRIVFDGLLAGYNIYLGSGIKSDLNAQYKNANEGVGIITSLPMSDDQIRKNITEGNARLLKAFVSALAGAGLSAKMQAQHASNVAQYGAALLAKDDPKPLIAADLASAREFLDAHPIADTSLTRYARFLYETGRGDADKVLELQELRRRK